MAGNVNKIREESVAQATIGGIVGLIFAILAGVVFAYSGGSAPFVWVSAVIAAGCIGFAIYKFIQLSNIETTPAPCSYCKRINTLVGGIEKDFVCQHCNRLVPVQDGKIMPVLPIECEHCNAKNFFSMRSIKLICDACGRDIKLENIRDNIDWSKVQS
jgi:DNA-directed RNA polymerase subunit RPC12/RpoP